MECNFCQGFSGRNKTSEVLKPLKTLPFISHTSSSEERERERGQVRESKRELHEWEGLSDGRGIEIVRDFLVNCAHNTSSVLGGILMAVALSRGLWEISEPLHFSRLDTTSSTYNHNISEVPRDKEAQEWVRVRIKAWHSERLRKLMRTAKRTRILLHSCSVKAIVHPKMTTRWSSTHRHVDLILCGYKMNLHPACHIYCILSMSHNQTKTNSIKVVHTHNYELNVRKRFKVPLLWVIKGLYFGFGRPPTTG